MEPDPVFSWAAIAATAWRIQPDIVYRVVGGKNLCLDVIGPNNADPSSPAGPAVVWFHGGGWIRGDKADVTLRLLPLLRLGFTVFNVNYRLASDAPAPAAAEDARYALRWVHAAAPHFRVDPRRVVVGGTSAGAHLAMLAAMLPVSAGLDRTPRNVSPAHGDSPGWWNSIATEPPPCAAIINLYGIADVADLVSGPNARNWAVDWIGHDPGLVLSRRLSPLHYVGPSAPPMVIVHGTRDDYVPYAHSERLKEALDAATIPADLITIPDGDHGDFFPDEWQRAWVRIARFLGEQGLIADA